MIKSMYFLETDEEDDQIGGLKTIAQVHVQPGGVKRMPVVR